jgi:octaprenyl-diphosphate synthase
MDIKSIQEYLGESWSAVRNRISSALKSDIELLNATNESILSHSGKQMRPMLGLLMAEACSSEGITDSTISYAAASELLHNATLLHDDVADGSMKRRGVPTIMSLMGPSVSVLVGDYWLVKAMDLIMDADEGNGSGVMRIFSKTLKDLAAGEMLQLQKAQKGDTDEQDYLRIIYSKTASLFEATCVSAAISVGASKDCVEAARAYAVALGIAFQIQDDILDYSGTEAVGKPLGADVLEQKITMPLLGALGQVSEYRASEIRKKIEDITDHPEYRDEILDFVRSNGGVAYAAAALDAYVAQAVDALAVLPDSKSKGYLVELAYFTARRKM